jgi:hypothetical protein
MQGFLRRLPCILCTDRRSGIAPVVNNRTGRGLYSEAQMQPTSVPKMAGEPLPQEFEDFFQEHYVLVYRTAYGITGRVEDAEDVVQTIFLRLLQRCPLPLSLLRSVGGTRKTEAASSRRTTAV